MTGKEAKERLEKQYKRQNKYIKEKYDRISATVPFGTIDRIKALGLKTNGLVKDLLLAELDRLEVKSKGTPQNPEAVMKKKEVKESTQVDEKVENKPHNELQDITPEQSVIRPEPQLLICNCKIVGELEDQQIKDDKHGRL